MIKKMKTIGNLAVFQGFDWDKEVIDAHGKADEFKTINIIYGRNYSGKTTLSRIFRAMETGELSDKFISPSFEILLKDGGKVDPNSLLSHGKKIRVFNEDFVRENLRFITDPDDSIEPFAILGEDNNKIEKEIEALEAELGTDEKGKETGLYAQKVEDESEYKEANTDLTNAQNALDKQLADKATDKKTGIKYKPERFGDQNYTKPKLLADIESVLSPSYESLSNENQSQYEKLITEKTLGEIPTLNSYNLKFSTLSEETRELVTKNISESDKIEDLLKNAVLNRWVSEGRSLHKVKSETCAFCSNKITSERWDELDRHFDEESEKFESSIDCLIEKLENEKSLVGSILEIKKELFYSNFHKSLNVIATEHAAVVSKYKSSLESLLTQLRKRKSDILTPLDFSKPEDFSDDLKTVLDAYKEIRGESNGFTDSLGAEQANAKKALRLREVSDFLSTINYQKQCDTIESLKDKRGKANSKKNEIIDKIIKKKYSIDSKKRELNDEEKGAIKVNEFLNNYFGHEFLSLEAKKLDSYEGGSKLIRFEVIRDGKKAYHLSEGERSLLAFCYFLAKLEDVDTKDSKPVIWIDDPISSLDGNHIFFVYSLLNTEIVESCNFEQLFISTHNLDFLKYMKRLNGEFLNQNGKMQNFEKKYFIVIREDKVSTIKLMPKYLKEYVTEFNYLFHQIYKCASIETVDDSNYTTFYSFGNNARKFFEIYLYYRYPDKGMTEETLQMFFGGKKIPAILTDRINNEYSHLCGVFERGSTPIEVPEMKKAALQIIERLKTDEAQYNSFLNSIGIATEVVEAVPEPTQ